MENSNPNLFGEALLVLLIVISIVTTNNSSSAISEGYQQEVVLFSDLQAKQNQVFQRSKGKEIFKE